MRAASLLALMLWAAPAAFAQIKENPHFRVGGLVVIWGADAASPTASAPVVSDFVIDTGTGATAATSGDADLISGNVHTVVTGSLEAVSDSWNASHGSPMVVQRIAGAPNTRLTDSNGDGIMSDTDAFAKFRLQSTTDTNMRSMELDTSFYAASNTAFNIDAQATAAPGTTLTQMQRIRLTLRTTVSGNDGIAFGSAAQYPHTLGAAGGSGATNRQLSTMITPRRVFTGNRRTAAAPGTIADQSVRFDLSYRYNFGAVDLSQGTFNAEATVVYTVWVP